MYTAIVFLPLLGAIIAGLIALAGAGARHPGGEPADNEHSSHGGGHAGAHDHAAHAPHHPSAIVASHHEPHSAHGDHGHHPAAPGSRAAELITSGLLVVSAILSWIAFFEVGFSESEAFTVPVFTFIQSGTLTANWALRIDTLTVAAAEAAIGLAILVVFYRNRGSIAVEDVNMMRG